MTQIALDTIWLAIAASLVFFMQAGFAMLESGLVRAKNTVNVLMKNLIDVGVVSVAFWAFGYGLMFGFNPTGWVGTSGFFYNSDQPWDLTLMFFQLMFAATTATIVSGALAERIRYWAYVISGVFISSVIYAIYGSWVWGSSSEQSSGWLKEMGFIDFAGSSVVHSIGGWCALAGVVALGPRLGRFSAEGKARLIEGHNLVLVALGALILWVGWFGFNGGSTLAATAEVGPILLNTHLAGSGGLLGAVLILGLQRRKILMTITVNGGLAGMVSICAGANSMDPAFAVLTGIIAGIIVVLGMELLEILRLDDAVGAVPLHGFCGVWGTLAAGMFQSGNLFDIHQIGVQIIGAGAAFAWAFPTAWLLFKAIDKFISLRASPADERRGLDYTEHYELSYPEFQQDQLHAGRD